MSSAHGSTTSWANLTVRVLGAWPSDEEVVWFNVAINQILLVDGLYAGEL